MQLTGLSVTWPRGSALDSAYNVFLAPLGQAQPVGESLPVPVKVVNPRAYMLDSWDGPSLHNVGRQAPVTNLVCQLLPAAHTVASWQTLIQTALNVSATLKAPYTSAMAAAAPLLPSPLWAQPSPPGSGPSTLTVMVRMMLTSTGRLLH
jgi:hypothetical protein